ncbi:gliding motility-associated C-terminal domain-containing protein [Flavobacterium sp. N1718]|uniref:DUF7507 domain-containing protein n=1 Tax=Flavobacterium sp. N1718 TaxID=2986822 RepID=UPI00222428ED|nr:gliding motility-associated C-terminal domain-containing protein [Flavobacterium sp. N1718]
MQSPILETQRFENLKLYDALLAINGADITASLAPGVTYNFSLDMDITQAMINSGSICNSASVVGSDDVGDVSDNDGIGTSDPTCVALLPQGDLTLIKTAVFVADGANGHIDYTFTLTNSGNVTVNTLTLTDDLLGITNQTISPSTLEPGQTATFTVPSYNVTDEDLIAGNVINCASVSGVAAIGGAVISDLSDDGDATNGDDNCTITVLTQTNSIAVVKQGTFMDENGNSYAEPGETISYVFTVTNTGDTTLVSVELTDTTVPVDFDSTTSGIQSTVSIGTLLPGESVQVTGSYILTEADIELGQVVNQASVRGIGPNGEEVSDVSDGSDNNLDNPTVTPLPVAPCTVVVNNLVYIGGMPGATGYDFEHLQIDGLTCYSDISIEIYNRWGVLVYETKDYNNLDKAFRGYSAGRVTISSSDPLPEGTYFYILRYKDGNNGREKTGFLHLTR